MRHIANPIYDVVFKFLLEDIRITKEFLSLLLKKEVVEVSMRRNEYTNPTKAEVHIFRIDFAAKVKEADGSVQIILIELQKAMVETETLRFRQYLGVQYANAENMLSEGDGTHLGVGMPIVAVYILGHELDGINEPVVYVRRNYLNYDNESFTRGVPNDFIESLTHDSIVVQIPKIRNRKDNPLFAMLNVFDQTRRDDNRHLLHIDDDEYSTSPVQKLILDRLTMAASDPEVRQTMNVEDEVLSALERRDNKIAEAQQQIEENEKIISIQKGQIASQHQQIASQHQQIASQHQQIALLVKMLMNGGQTIQEISIALNLTVDEVRQIIEEG